MPWVNKDSYSPGKRHYFEGEVVFGEPKETWRGPNYVEWDEFIGPALCGTSLTTRGSAVKRADGTYKPVYGGLSVKDKVNLMQRNLCSYCLKQYLDKRPDLRACVAAVEAG